jgi:hypothetical protein
MEVTASCVWLTIDETTRFRMTRPPRIARSRAELYWSGSSSPLRVDEVGVLKPERRNVGVHLVDEAGDRLALRAREQLEAHMPGEGPGGIIAGRDEGALEELLDGEGVPGEEPHLGLLGGGEVGPVDHDDLVQLGVVDHDLGGHDLVVLEG